MSLHAHGMTATVSLLALPLPVSNMHVKAGPNSSFGQLPAELYASFLCDVAR